MRTYDQEIELLTLIHKEQLHLKDRIEAELKRLVEPRAVEMFEWPYDQQIDVCHKFANKIMCLKTEARLRQLEAEKFNRDFKKLVG